METWLERIDTFILRVGDWWKAVEWYKTKLGLEAGFVDEQEGYAVLKVGQLSFTLYQLKPGESRPPAGSAVNYPILYSRDVERSRQTLFERGVEVEPIQETGSVRFFGFADLDGNRIEVCQW